MTENNSAGIKSQFATRNLGLAMQIYNCIAKHYVKHMVKVHVRGMGAMMVVPCITSTYPLGYSAPS